MSRRLNRDYRTKIRNIPRRMKALNCWAESFQNPERAVFAEDQRYWNFKIPVDINLVEGKHRTQKTQAECAQALINACSHLMQATADLAGTIGEQPFCSRPGTTAGRAASGQENAEIIAHPGR